MKTYLITAVIALSLAVTACGKPQTNEEKIQEQVTSGVHGLTADERQAAMINAKSYYDKEWITAGNARGQLNSCRPSDSNSNGMVTCNGFVPQVGGTFKETKMYCGYRPEIVGCSDEDTVK